MTDLLLHHAQLLLDVVDEVHDVWGHRIDCVPGHAVLVINTYPRRSAPGTVLGFRLAPSSPSGAKVLRARLTITARRVCDMKRHGN